MSRAERIIICDVCKGSGKIQQEECVDYHHNDYDYWDEICTNCKGLGRLKQTITIVTVPLTKNDLMLREKDE